MNIALVSDRVDLPDGTYTGGWAGHQIWLDGHPGVHIETSDGCNAGVSMSLAGSTPTSIPVTVTVAGGRATATMSRCS